MNIWVFNKYNNNSNVNKPQEDVVDADKQLHMSQKNEKDRNHVITSITYIWENKEKKYMQRIYFKIQIKILYFIFV